MKTMKRILALLFALILVLSLLPAVASAATERHYKLDVVSSDQNKTGEAYTAWKAFKTNALGSSIATPDGYGDLDNQQFFIADYIQIINAKGTTDQTIKITAQDATTKESVNVSGYIGAYLVNSGFEGVVDWWPLMTNDPIATNNEYIITRSTADPETAFFAFAGVTHFYIGFALTSEITADTTVTITVTRTVTSGAGAQYDLAGSTAYASYTFKAPAPAANPVTVGESETLTVTAGAASTNNGTTTSEVSVAVDNAAKATVSTSGEEVNSNNVNVESVVTELVEGGEIHTGNNSVVFTLDKQQQAGATESSATYDVVPMLSVNEGEPVVVSNAQLTGPVTFKLRAPAGASEGSYVTAVHTYDADANITAGSETFKNLLVDADKNVTLTLRHFSEVTLTLQDGVVPDAIIRSMNGYLADYFVLNFYVTTDVQNPRFAFNRAYDSKTLQQVNTKAEFCESNVAVYYVEYVEKGGANALGLKSTSGVTPGTYMVSVKFFTKFLDQDVTLSMTDANDRALNIKGYGYTNGGTTIGTSAVATSHSYSFTDFLNIMKLYQGSGYENLYNGLSAAAEGARSIEGE